MRRIVAWALVLPMFLATLVTLRLSYYLPSWAAARHLTTLTEQPLPAAQWWQALLISLATSFLGILLTVLYVNVILAKQEEARWRRARREAGYLLTALIEGTLQALNFSLRRPDLVEPIEGLDASAPAMQQRQILVARRPRLQDVLTRQARNALRYSIIEQEDTGANRLNDLQKSSPALLLYTDEWLRLFGHRLDPDTVEALIDIRRRLYILQRLNRNLPLDDRTRYSQWLREGATHWQEILARLARLLSRL